MLCAGDAIIIVQADARHFDVHACHRELKLPCPGLYFTQHVVTDRLFEVT